MSEVFDQLVQDLRIRDFPRDVQEKIIERYGSTLSEIIVDTIRKQLSPADRGTFEIYLEAAEYPYAGIKQFIAKRAPHLSPMVQKLHHDGAMEIVETVVRARNQTQQHPPLVQPAAVALRQPEQESKSDGASDSEEESQDPWPIEGYPQEPFGCTCDIPTSGPAPKRCDDSHRAKPKDDDCCRQLIEILRSVPGIDERRLQFRKPKTKPKVKLANLCCTLPVKERVGPILMLILRRFRKGVPPGNNFEARLQGFLGSLSVSSRGPLSGRSKRMTASRLPRAIAPLKPASMTGLMTGRSIRASLRGTLSARCWHWDICAVSVQSPRLCRLLA